MTVAAAAALIAVAVDRAAARAQDAPAAAEPPLAVRCAFVRHGLATSQGASAAAFEPALSAARGGPCRVLTAVGSYDDVATWVARESVDLALLPPGVYGVVAGDPRIHLVTATEHLAPFGRATPRERRSYRATLAARRGSALWLVVALIVLLSPILVVAWLSRRGRNG